MVFRIFYQEIIASSDLGKLLLQKEIMLKEQSRIKWLKERDLNSAFFHSVIKRRKKSNLLRHMEINGVLVDNADDIVTQVLAFYKDPFYEQSNY